MFQTSHMSTARPLLSITLVMTLGCASGAPPAPTSASTATPTSVEQLLAREGTVGSLRSVSGGEAGWTTRTDARAGDLVHDPEEEMWWTHVPIGEDGIRCYVYESQRDLAALAVFLTDHHVSRAIPEGGKAPEKRLAGLDVDVIDGTGYLELRWVFTMAHEGATLLFDSKAAVANRHGRGLACESLDSGYFETFQAVFRHWVGSFDADVEWPAYFRETIRTHIGDQPVGLSTVTMQRDEDGDTKMVMANAMLIPTGPGSLSQLDQNAIEWTREDGTLIAAFEFEADAHGLTTDIALQREDGVWRATGKMADKEIAAELGDVDLTSNRSDYLALARQLVPVGDRTEMVMARWVASADPTSVLEVRHTDIQVADDGTSTMVTHLGPVTTRGERDASGALVRAEIAVGAQTMTMERLHVEGAP